MGFAYFGLGKKRRYMKKYLLLVEDEKLWEKFKEAIKNDINSEIIELIKKKVEGKEAKK
jgi:hypothetical protein